MENTYKIYRRTFFAITIVLGAINFSDAQTIQKESVRAPENVKIDGKIDEWGALKAENSIDRIRYTISNDDENLYLVVQAMGVWSNAKIMRGAITFTISRTVDKNARITAKDNFSITFPVIDRTTANAVNAKQYAYYDIKANDRKLHKKEIDSLYNSINTLIKDSFNTIKVTGIPDVDTVISIYNQRGIKAAALFNSEMNYNYELAIPLKYLNLSGMQLAKLSYNIKLNGSQISKFHPVPNKIYNNEDPNDTPTTGDEVTFANKTINPDYAYKNFPTSFWAEYSLAIK